MYQYPLELKDKPVLPIYISVVEKKDYTYADRVAIEQFVKDIFNAHKDRTLVIFTSGNSVALKSIYEGLKEQLKELFYQTASAYIHDYLKFIPVKELVTECDMKLDDYYIYENIRDAMSTAGYIYFLDNTHSRDKKVSYELDAAHKVKAYAEGFGLKEHIPDIVYKLM